MRPQPMHASGAQSARTRGNHCITCTIIIQLQRAIKELYYQIQNSVSKFRWDMSASESLYSTPPPKGKARTLAALSANCHFSQPKRHLGSKNPPMLPLEPTSLVLDELHLLLRIGDILLRNLILQADSLDHKAYMATGRRTDSNLRSLELLIKQCGVSFSIAFVLLHSMYYYTWCISFVLLHSISGTRKGSYSFEIF